MLKKINSKDSIKYKKKTFIYDILIFFFFPFLYHKKLRINKHKN